MKNFCVTITRTGYVFVRAHDEAEAMDLANHQLTDTVNWSDDWEATECEPNDSCSDNAYITEKAFA